MKNTEKTLYLIFALMLIIGFSIAAYAPYREKEVFNEYKDPNQPEATYLDAVFSKLRVTSK